MSKPTRDEITKLAQECQLIGIQPHLDGIYQESLERFFHAAYAAGAAAEREACAKVCYEMFHRTGLWAALQLSDAIKARGNT